MRQKDFMVCLHSLSGRSECREAVSGRPQKMTFKSCWISCRHFVWKRSPGGYTHFLDRSAEEGRPLQCFRRALSKLCILAIHYTDAKCRRPSHHTHRQANRQQTLPKHATVESRSQVSVHIPRVGATSAQGCQPLNFQCLLPCSSVVWCCYYHCY